MQQLSRQTLYEQVYQILATRIVDGTYSENSFLPNEFDLSQEFSVSIGTVRKSVELLVHEKLLVRQQGRGTIVTDGHWLNIRLKANRIRHGETAVVLSWNYRDIDVRQKPASAAVATRLNISEGELVHYIQRVRSAEPEVKVLEHNYTPVKLFPEFNPDEHGRSSVVATMGRNAQPLGRVQEACMAVVATKERAALMEIEPGAPLLKMLRIINDKNNVPVEFRVAYMYSPECYHFTNVD